MNSVQAMGFVEELLKISAMNSSLETAASLTKTKVPKLPKIKVRTPKQPKQYTAANPSLPGVGIAHAQMLKSVPPPISAASSLP